MTTRSALQCFTVRCAAVAARLEDPYIDTTMKVSSCLSTSNHTTTSTELTAVTRVCVCVCRPVLRAPSRCVPLECSCSSACGPCVLTAAMLSCSLQPTQRPQTSLNATRSAGACKHHANPDTHHGTCQFTPLQSEGLISTVPVCAQTFMKPCVFVVILAT